MENTEFAQEANSVFFWEVWDGDVPAKKVSSPADFELVPAKILFYLQISFVYLPNQFPRTFEV
jgi:hypothetical protein